MKEDNLFKEGEIPRFMNEKIGYPVRNLKFDDEESYLGPFTEFTKSYLIYMKEPGQKCIIKQDKDTRGGLIISSGNDSKISNISLKPNALEKAIVLTSSPERQELELNNKKFTIIY